PSLLALCAVSTNPTAIACAPAQHEDSAARISTFQPIAPPFSYLKFEPLKAADQTTDGKGWSGER
ncbi:MAG TPA: hypothetical protein VKB53_07270, partial [Gammaproteobacteria bacterium]|nr:hypothetical protein [Gammaproteobacteria bacterium]